MTTTIIITLCLLLLAAYLFDLTAARTRIPAVILLLALGWGLRQLTNAMALDIPDLASVLPVFGTIGLILIVMEGSLELDLNRGNLKVMGKAALMALLPLLVMAFALAFLTHFLHGDDFLASLTNAIPLSIISSAIAIPAAQAFDKPNRAFVIYESSFSDIFGVLVFNFVALNDDFGLGDFGEFGLDLFFIFVISAVATFGLAFLLSRIRHHVKFAPIILLTILIYAISKVFHLPGLILIMVFGLFLGNLDQLRQFKWIERLRPEVLEGEVQKLKELVTEAAFLLRSMFFLLFGYQIKNEEIMDIPSFLFALAITLGIFGIRAGFLWMFKMDIRKFLFLAPRGLITVLLFLSLPAERFLPGFSNGLVMQVILLTALGLLLGAMVQPKVSSTDGHESAAGDDLSQGSQVIAALPADVVPPAEELDSASMEERHP